MSYASVVVPVLSVEACRTCSQSMISRGSALVSADRSSGASSKGRSRPSTLRGKLDPLGGVTLSKALDALAAPVDKDDEGHAPRRNADAVTELAEIYLGAGAAPGTGQHGTATPGGAAERRDDAQPGAGGASLEGALDAGGAFDAVTTGRDVGDGQGPAAAPDAGVEPVGRFVSDLSVTRSSAARSRDDEHRRRPVAQLIVTATLDTITGTPGAPGGEVEGSLVVAAETGRRYGCDANVSRISSAPRRCSWTWGDHDVCPVPRSGGGCWLALPSAPGPRAAASPTRAGWSLTTCATGAWAAAARTPTWSRSAGSTTGTPTTAAGSCCEPPMGG